MRLLLTAVERGPGSVSRSALAAPRGPACRETLMIMDAGRLASPFGMAHGLACGLAQGVGHSSLTVRSRDVGVPQALGCPWGPVPRAWVGHDPQKYTGIHISSALTRARGDISSSPLTEGRVSDACPRPREAPLGCWAAGARVCPCLPHSWLTHICPLALCPLALRWQVPTDLRHGMA